MSRIIKILIAVVIVILLAGSALYQYKNGATKFNDGFVNGNSQGNLYNKGLFCELNGIVYFSNPLDHYFLYSMTVDGHDYKLLYDDIVSYINTDGTYIYYVRNNRNKDTQFSFLNYNMNSLCRYDPSSDSVKILDSDPSTYASLSGNMLYYIHYDSEEASRVYRIRIDGKYKEEVFAAANLTCGMEGQYLYYAGVEQDHDLHRYDTESGAETTLLKGNLWNPIVVEPYVYYMDAEADYALKRTNLTSGETLSITTDRVDCFNVYNDTIYFQRNGSEPALCRINTDGTSFEQIASGNYTNINITSYAVYFTEYGIDDTIYMTLQGGDGSVTTFLPY
ncbi:MAG: DUF5050 domain-containing protein [Lachnospiraceae bacterium]